MGLLRLELTASCWGTGATCHLLLRVADSREQRPIPWGRPLSGREGCGLHACPLRSLCRRANHGPHGERDLASGSAVTHDHRLGGLERWRFILSQRWRLEVGNQGVRRAARGGRGRSLLVLPGSELHPPSPRGRLSSAGLSARGALPEPHLQRLVSKHGHIPRSGELQPVV